MKHSTRKLFQIAIATLLMAAVSTPAQAQLGGLLNKAKNAAKGVIEGKSTGQIASEAIAESRSEAYTKEQLRQLKAKRAEKEKKAQDESGQTGNLPEAKRGDVNFYMSSGKRMGIWHPKEKTFEKFGLDANGKWATGTYTFKNDGKVYYQNGDLRGIINKDGTMRSVNTEDIKVFDEGYISWKNEQIGYINQLGEIWFMDDVMAYSDEPIDNKIAAYIFFCNWINNDYITEWKPKYEALKEQRAIERIKKHGPVTFGGGGGGARLNSTDRWELNGENLTLNGTRVAMIKSGGDIRDAANVPLATLRSDGSVVSIGKGVLGTMKSSGECQQTGKGYTYKMSSAGDLSDWAGPGVGRLASGFNLAAAAYIFLIYAPKKDYQEDLHSYQ